MGRPAPKKPIFMKFKILATLLFQLVTSSTRTPTRTTVLKALLRVNNTPFLKQKIVITLLLRTRNTPSSLTII